jgi:hypothetical protein
MHMQYWSAELWNRLFPIITMGDHMHLLDVYKYLKTLPQDDRIVMLLNQQCINKFEKYGIDHNFIY